MLPTLESYHGGALIAQSVETVVRVLNEAKVRYLIAGGLAVVEHGYLRFTGDIDLVISLDPANVKRALQALAGLGYRPVVAAVRMDDLADPDARREWIEQKDAKVLQLYSDAHRLTSIDIFIEEPFDFDRAERDGLRDEIAPNVTATFVGLADLLEMKRKAGRPQDLADIAEVEGIARGKGGA